MDKRPLLSICIPTYNRAEIIKSMLSRFLANEACQEDVEIVISDNCSTDNTENICRAIASKYSFVKYYRNEENVKDRNFSMALNRGEGYYVKLLNDWCYYDNESIVEMKRAIKEHIEDKTPIFFSSHFTWRNRKANSIECKSLNDYVDNISVMVTFNNLFGSWKEIWDEIDDKNRYSRLQLLQVDWTYKIVSKYGCILYNAPILKYDEVMTKQVRRGYNYFNVMVNNYYTIMQPYIDRGEITNATYTSDRKHLLDHFRPELFQALVWRSGPLWQYDVTGTWSILYRRYKDLPYFYLFILTLPFQYLLHASVRDFGKKL